ncbi:helix-turn-helix domain-containing protein [Pararhizobium antarcticum]|uniref:HTH araC/xylS-type domain-containing protein n=1 Tax=Pararhizobium antarcticum TaxID=1798805 RepID=A0A657LUX3_9HYPH|nr:AraC family transcriptional regulator [Pararhizobium antarcticum]OJF97749.1 hypothetical protein AX760_15910 [Pararhizobium antarcticum]
MDRKQKFQIHFKEGDAAAEITTAKSWRGVSVQFSRLKLPAEYEFKWEGHSHYLAHHDLVLLDGEMEVVGERPVAAQDLRDKMTYVPAGQTITGWCSPVARLNAFTVVNFNPVDMEEELQVEFNGAEPRPQIYFKDDALGATMRKLGRLMADKNQPAAKVYIETVGLTAALEMFRISQPETTKIKLAGQLSQAQANMVKEFIAENLARDIGLDDLASVCGLTRFHFSRSFKATFGEPPHRYLTRVRMERATQMLAATKLSLSDIAGACGFNGISQFGRAFRDVVGKTPLEFRRQA